MWGIFHLYYLYYTLPGSKARMGFKSQAVWTKDVAEPQQEVVRFTQMKAVLETEEDVTS